MLDQLGLQSGDYLITNRHPPSLVLISNAQGFVYLATTKRLLRRTAAGSTLRIEMRLEDDKRDDSDDDDDFFDATSADVDIDAPPAFPAINSAQRSSNVAPSAPSKGFTVSGPSVGGKAEGKAPSKSSSLREVLGVPASNLNRPAGGGGSGGGLMVPPSTSSKTAPPGVGGASGARLGGGGSMLGVPKETGGGARKKVVLQPGCSPLDWARLKSSGDPSLRVGTFCPCKSSAADCMSISGVCHGHASREAVGAQAAQQARRRMVGLQWQSVQHHPLPPLPPWWREGVDAMRRQGWHPTI